MDVHLNASLDRRLVVRTPENLELSYQLAGAGTRAAAYVIDVFLMVAIVTVFQNLIAAALTPLLFEMRSYVAAALGILSFVCFNAYFIVFELLWAGQSPGKRLVGIRVVKTGGYALRFPDSLMRNLLRAVDFLPVFYGIGLTSLLLTRYCQRIGDLVAGTLVVYQGQNAADAILSTNVAGNQATQLPIVKLREIPPEVIETCDEFLRTRGQLAPKYRQQLADDLLDLIEKWCGLQPEANQSAEAFLGCVVTQVGQIPVAS